MSEPSAHCCAWSFLPLPRVVVSQLAVQHVYATLLSHFRVRAVRESVGICGRIAVNIKQARTQPQCSTDPSTRNIASSWCGAIDSDSMDDMYAGRQDPVAEIDMQGVESVCTIIVIDSLGGEAASATDAGAVSPCAQASVRVRRGAA